MALAFNTDFDPQHGSAVPVAPNVARVTAPNSSSFTFHGTNSYLIGTRSLAIIDPGPLDETHFEALMQAIDGRPVDAIILTHTHLDHTPLTQKLKQATGADVYAQGPHRAYRELDEAETARLGRSADLAFMPDHHLQDGDTVSGHDWELEAVHTPGHTANHIALSLHGTELMFSGDHVMGWSTTIVAPPDGSMTDYLRSLERLLARPQSHYLPGHGDTIPKAHAYVKGLKTHRLMRESAIMRQLDKGVTSISELVVRLYRTTPEHLHGAAAMTVLAHLEALVENGKAVASDTPATLESSFTPR
ncbi:MAG: MBL fold metallo-hydrolase [Rhizobiales bacterium]|nr:MBL fold metallo-hydrolase [Hyphomicrobiales bacterium]